VAKDTDDPAAAYADWYALGPDKPVANPSPLG
jgi:hypothetical protein